MVEVALDLGPKQCRTDDDPCCPEGHRFKFSAPTGILDHVVRKLGNDFDASAMVSEVRSASAETSHTATFFKMTALSQNRPLRPVGLLREAIPGSPFPDFAFLAKFGAGL